MTATSYDEPTGGTPRGTLVVIPGRGETPTSYRRFGTRISNDAWKVRLVSLDLDDLDATRAEIAAVLADESLPSPKVLVGTDAGAALAATFAADLPVDAVVLAGLVLPDSRHVASWEEEVEARTACPVHRRVIGEDASFKRGSLDRELPWERLSVGPLDVPTLVLHGTADPVTPYDEVVVLFGDAARVRLVQNGLHDVLNDAPHRAVAATIVLFLESLRLGADLPDVVSPAASLAVTA